MMTVFAHIAGMPVEETLLFAGPTLGVVAATVGARLRRLLRRRPRDVDGR
jgi:hypothetical protein